MEKIRVVALGGLSENGKNCYCIEVDEDIFVIDCGLKYPSVNNPGIDFTIPNFDYLRKNSSRVKAVIITHGHDDQYGALPYLLNLINVPVYASSTTINMIRMDYAKKFRRFQTYHFVTVLPSSTVTIAGHLLDFFSTTHSISNSFGFALHTEAGNIVFTSDFMSDYNHVRNFTFDLPRLCKIAEANPTLLLMSESVKALLPGTASPRHRLTPHIFDLIENMNGQLFIALYSQNFYNIQEIIELAVKSDKKICFANQTLASFKKAFNVSGDLVIPDSNYVELRDLSSVPENERIILLTGSGLNLFSDIKEVCYGGIPELKVSPSDTFVMACPSVAETEIQHTEALDTVFATGCRVKNITRRDISSMHAQEEDIKMMLTLLRPRYYMPVKGEFRQLMGNAKIAVNMDIGLNHRNIFVYDNGMFLKIDEKGNFISAPEKANVSDVVVDGSIVGEVRENILEERATMSSDGVILMGCLISLKEKRLLSNPDIQMRGFIYLKDASDIVSEVSKSFVSSLDGFLKESKGISMSEMERKIGDKMTRVIKKMTEKEPLVICELRNADEAERSLAQRNQARNNKNLQNRPYFNNKPNPNKANHSQPGNAQNQQKVPNFTLPTPRKPIDDSSDGK